MDFIFSDIVKRHIRKFQHECEKILADGVFKDEIYKYTFTVDTFLEGEVVSKKEIENLNQFYRYLCDQKIAVGNLPTRPSAKEGTLDYEFDENHDSFEFITERYVSVRDYEKLSQLIDKELFKISSLDSSSLKHLRGRALTYDNAKFQYHQNTIKFDVHSSASKYLRAILVLAHEEDTIIDCNDVAELCNEEFEGFTKKLKDSLNQTVLPRLKRHNERNKEFNFSINTKLPGKIRVKNPRLYKTA